MHITFSLFFRGLPAVPKLRRRGFTPYQEDYDEMIKMMIESSSKGHQAKQEAGDVTIDTVEKFSKAPSTSRQWTAFRNPRIVRVSRSLGGKDRHSKVCTIRGLRDRRIRLSVPTAIQLYDLQDRLGLSQPSKVIDWLLEATKLDIDKLPPLQIPQGFAQFQYQQTLLPHHEPIISAPHQFSLGGFYDASSAFIKDGGNQSSLLAKSRYWEMDSVSRLKGKEADQGDSISEKGKWIKTNLHENQDGIGGGYKRQDSVQKLFPIGTNSNSSLSGLLNNAMTYNSFHSEPSSLTLSQFGSHGLFPSQLDPHSSSGSGVQPSSSFPVVPSGSQLLLCPSSATPSPLFTPYAPFMANSSVESDPRQFNHIQILSSGSQVMPHTLVPSSLHSINSPLRRLPTPFSSKLLDSDNDNRSSQPDHKGSTRS